MRYIPVLFCLLSSLFVQANDIYTIIAPSGLSLRSGPGTEYERLVVVPFNAQVTYDESVENSWEQVSLGEFTGYWIPVRYAEHSGYMFSAYLHYGLLYQPATNGQNDDYRILIPGDRIRPLNYDSNLHWYALCNTQPDATTPDYTLIQQDPIVNIDPLTEAEHQQLDYESSHFSRIQTPNKDQEVVLFIGTKTPINDLTNLAPITYLQQMDENSYHNWGRPIYPYETLRMINKAKESTGFLFGEILHDETIQELHYYLRLRVREPNGDWSNHQLSELMTHYNYNEDAQTTYRYFPNHPRIFWQADLNHDGLSDYLFFRPDNSECCGGSEGFYLIMSEYQNSRLNYRNVASDEIEFMGGC